MTTKMERNTTALLAHSEDDGSGEWSDEDADAAVALNGDWGTPEAPRRTRTTSVNNGVAPAPSFSTSAALT